MRHDANSTNVKEHIICNADDHEKNRHHWSLFVRNCRLVLLVRRDFHSGNLNTFKPAEWRWKRAEVCDDAWHHYAVSYNQSVVTLYVDGERDEGGEDHQQVIDDWPLHPTKDESTRTSVGACWLGREGHMKWFLHGYLAGLSVLLGGNEEAPVLACLHACREGLQYQGEEEDQVHVSGDEDSISFTTHDPARGDVLMRKVAYKNSRQFPTPGRRDITVTTDVTCKSGEEVSIPPVTTTLLVLAPAVPVITISGTPNMARDYEQLKMGVKIFSDVGLSVTTHTPGQEQDTTTTPSTAEGESGTAYEGGLDACVMTVDPPLNPEHEYLTVPTNLLRDLGMAVRQRKEGVRLSGADKVYNYEDVLRQVHYYNRKPEYYLTRAFSLACSEMEGRYRSNDYNIELSVIHSDPATPVHAHLRQDILDTDSGVGQQPNLIMTGNTANEVTTAAPSHAVAVIIVVCVGFLVFMIVLGIIRIRAAHHRGQDSDEEKPEMAWDDSSLTITVNPIEGDSTTANANHIDMVSSDEEDEDDDDSIDYNEEDVSSDDDDDDDDDGVGASRGQHGGRAHHHHHTQHSKLKGQRDLEWDDSTLSF